MKCRWCGEEIDLSQVDVTNDGFFCDDCDGFTSFDESQRNHFILALESKGENTALKGDGKLCKKLRGRYSPLRYPGGKGKLAPFIYELCNTTNLHTFVEPFAGGVGVGLAFLMNGICDKLVINDLDFGIYSLFSTIKEEPETLLFKIAATGCPTHADFFRAQKNVLTGYKKSKTKFDAAWDFLLCNRLAYSGISKANPLGGRNGDEKSLRKRWNQNSLISRIRAISIYGEKIEVRNSNAEDIIEEFYWVPNTTIFIDPPYYEKGTALYTHSFTNDNHRHLATTLNYLYSGIPGSDIILTYDNAEFVKNLYWCQSKTIEYTNRFCV